MNPTKNLDCPCENFIDIYWDVKENHPSQALKDLFTVLLPSIAENTTLDHVVKETQARWIQKARWEVKMDAPDILQLREKILPIFNSLGLMSSITPRGQFDTALLLGGRANIFLDRCYALASALKEGEIQLSQIDVLVGKQPLHPLEKEILKNCSLEIEDAQSEDEMAEKVCEQMLTPLGVHWNMVPTDLKDRRPNTEQTVHTWLDLTDRKAKSAVIVSDPQFAVYQYMQCMEALYKRNIKEIKFDLLSKQFETHVFQELKISIEETQENPILLYLDTIARTLYTLQSQMNRGFI